MQGSHNLKYLAEEISFYTNIYSYSLVIKGKTWHIELLTAALIAGHANLNAL